MTQDGSGSGGARATLGLRESYGASLDLNPAGFHVGTLDHLIDGEEWLEAAFSRLNKLRIPVARVRIGPTERVNVYEHSDSLQKAISLLTVILAPRGLIVVVYGKGPAIRAEMVDERWTLSAPQNATAGRVKVQRAIRWWKYDRVRRAVELSRGCARGSYAHWLDPIPTHSFASRHGGRASAPCERLLERRPSHPSPRRDFLPAEPSNPAHQ
jgi:hypothetical protein